MDSMHRFNGQTAEEIAQLLKDLHDALTQTLRNAIKRQRMNGRDQAAHARVGPRGLERSDADGPGPS